jgi:hypothetical protein
MFWLLLCIAMQSISDATYSDMHVLAVMEKATGMPVMIEKVGSSSTMASTVACYTHCTVAMPWHNHGM